MKLRGGPGSHWKQWSIIYEDHKEAFEAFMDLPPSHWAKYEDPTIKNLIKNMTYNKKFQVLGLTNLPPFT
jgi:hypothetical protein